MSDFFDNPEEFEKAPSRLEAFSAGRAKRRRNIVIVAVSMIVMLLILVGAAFALKVLPFGTKSKAKQVATTSTSAKTVKANKTLETTEGVGLEAGDTSATPSIRQVANMLIIGVQEIGESKAAKGLLLAKIDLTNGSIQAVNIPDRTYLNINSLGLDQISKSFNMGLATTKKTVEDLMHVTVDNHIIMHYEDFEFLVSDNRFQDAFEKTIETNLFENEKKAYGIAVSRIDTSKISIVALPVKYMSINGEPFYEPDNQEISSLIESLWGIKIEIKTQPVRIIVLNGSGQPGVGKQVSDKLSPDGFVIIDVRNASSFNYKTTQIVAYKEEFLDKAKELKQMLGVGEAVYHPVSQDVAEIAIIVGHDFKPAN